MKIRYYTLTLGTVTDPGLDSVTSYIVNWGDGQSDTYALPGDVTHVYTVGGSNPIIVVDLVDEDGTHPAAATLPISVTVTDTETPVIGNKNATLAEGATLVFTGLSSRRPTPTPTMPR